MKWLCLTLAAVLTLIASGNLVLFAAAWITTSLCLHQLLTFYAERPAALLAARKKFIVSRLGEACLIGAVVLVYLSFGSVEFGTVFAAADATGRSGADTTQAAYLPWIAALLVIAALLKSAQFPFHGWLPEVMETPTPVSALLHAGIINAGGFLIVRMSHVVSLSTPSLDVLAVVGALTALFGSVVMLTQNSIKVSLAYSTVAQMGFMLLQCGLGAFSAAVLHIVGHSLYKAHAFLSSGSVVDRVKASWTPVAHDRPHPFRLLFALIAVALLTFAVGLAFGASPDAEPGVFALGAILLMALTYLFWNAIGERPAAAVVLRGAALAVVVCVGYFALQLAFEWLLQSALPAAQATRGNVEFLLLGGVIALFMVVFVLQTQLPYRADSPRWHAAYVHLFNGLYVNTVANRLIQRLWPVEPRVATQGVQE